VKTALRGFPDDLLTMQFHGNTFNLPEGTVLLASSPLYPHQAFRWRQAYGFQFHLEASPAMVRDWLAVPAYISYLGLEVTAGPAYSLTSRPMSRNCAQMGGGCSSSGST